MAVVKMQLNDDSGKIVDVELVDAQIVAEPWAEYIVPEMGLVFRHRAVITRLGVMLNEDGSRSGTLLWKTDSMSDLRPI